MAKSGCCLLSLTPRRWASARSRGLLAVGNRSGVSCQLTAIPIPAGWHARLTPAWPYARHPALNHHPAVLRPDPPDEKGGVRTAPARRFMRIREQAEPLAGEVEMVEAIDDMRRCGGGIGSRRRSKPSPAGIPLRVRDRARSDRSAGYPAKFIRRRCSSRRQDRPPGADSPATQARPSTRRWAGFQTIAPDPSPSQAPYRPRIGAVHHVASRLPVFLPQPRQGSAESAVSALLRDRSMPAAHTSPGQQARTPSASPSRPRVIRRSLPPSTSCGAAQAPCKIAPSRSSSVQKLGPPHAQLPHRRQSADRCRRRAPFQLAANASRFCHSAASSGSCAPLAGTSPIAARQTARCTTRRKSGDPAKINPNRRSKGPGAMAISFPTRKPPDSSAGNAKGVEAYAMNN